MAYLGIGEERDPLAGIKALLGGVVPEQWPGREGPTVLPAGGGGMVPSPVNPEAIRMFTEKVNPPGQLTGNIGNLPPGDFLRMLYNPDITAPAPAPTPTGTPTGPVAAPVLSPVDVSVANAIKMAGQYANQGVLPWDFFARNPDVSGGIGRVMGAPTQWDIDRAARLGLPAPKDQTGRVFQMFEPKKPADMMDTIRPLIQQYADRASTMLTTPSSNPRQDAMVMDAFMRNINALIGTSQTGAKVPSEIGRAESEIARNIAEARRWQVAPDVYVGPEEKGTLVSQAGGPWKEAARGGPQEKMTPLQATQKKINEMEVALWGDIYGKEIAPEGKAFALGKINEALGRARGTQPQAAQPPISKKDYYAQLIARGIPRKQIDQEWPRVVAQGKGIE